MKRIAFVVLALVAAAALGKLPPPTDEQKVKAEEAKAKAADAAKKDADLLAATQNKVASRYIAAMRVQGKIVKPTPIPPPAPAAPVVKK